MSIPSIFSFIRSADLSGNVFSHDISLSVLIPLLQGIRKLQINNSSLSNIPLNINLLEELEQLSVSYNDLKQFSSELSKLNNLQTFVCRHNQIVKNSIPSCFFDIENLAVLDLAYNNLDEIPEGIENAKNITSLNLSHNQLTTVPAMLFIKLTAIAHLDLSYNQLNTMPPQLRRLTLIKCLILSENPLMHAHLKSLPCLNKLETLYLSNTNRNIANIPTGLSRLLYLTDLDLSHNHLSVIPPDVYELKNLRILSMNDNAISEISSELNNWSRLQILNLSRNRITALPYGISMMKNLKQLYLNENQLTFDGVPGYIGKLISLEVLSLSGNKLKILTEGISRCINLKKLILTDNDLITLPDSIYFLTKFKLIETSGNTNLVMPEKPKLKIDVVKQLGIDFSLEYQLEKCAPSLKEVYNNIETKKKPDRTNRRIRIHKGWMERHDDGNRLLSGMRKIATSNDSIKYKDNLNQNKISSDWQDSLKKPDLNYSDIFDESTGMEAGLTIWEIEQFLPIELDEVDYGVFYDSDCYIILQSTHDVSLSIKLVHKIWYLIGVNSAIDKATSAAINAVNLRNYLSAKCRTIRQEMYDEDDSFKELFPHGITYIPGSHTPSGLYSYEKPINEIHFYRIKKKVEENRSKLMYVPHPLCYTSLSSESLYIMTDLTQSIMWIGTKVSAILKHQTNLLLTSINSEDKSKNKIIEVSESEEPENFMSHFHNEKNCDCYIENDEKYHSPILYTVEIGSGYLQLNQIKLEHDKNLYDQSCLKSESVYILDSYYSVSVWFGKKSSRLVRSAAAKLYNEIFDLIDRPKYAIKFKFMEGKETYFFRSQFYQWDNIQTANYVKIAQKKQTKKTKQHDANLIAVFRPRISIEESPNLFKSTWDIDFDSNHFLVYDNKNFKKLPDEERGLFYSKNCYVILIHYNSNDEKENGDSTKNTKDDSFDGELYPHVFFWQGRDSGNKGWVAFSLSLKHKFIERFDTNITFQRVYQQQEGVNFFATFPNGIVIRRGNRDNKDYNLQNHLFETRYIENLHNKRSIEIGFDCRHFDSNFTYILYTAPTDDNAISVYTWVGSLASKQLIELGNHTSKYFENVDSNQIIYEADEPPEFWTKYGTKLPLCPNTSFFKQSRLFRCSFEKGYFILSEKFIDFCQDDLNGEDVMLLDTGSIIYVWVGKYASQVEITCSLFSAKLYREFLKLKNVKTNRSIRLAPPENEPIDFKECFHGWDHSSNLIRE